jgi:hypothetical protein
MRWAAAGTAVVNRAIAIRVVMDAFMEYPDKPLCHVVPAP